jgi:putative aldouronate transport system substrate-binding protein
MRAPDGTGLERFLEVMSRERYEPHAQRVENLLPPLYYAGDDVLMMTTMATNINTFVDESIARFIVGDISIETGWASYLSTLRGLGIDRYLQIIQTTLDASPFGRR